MNNPYIYLFKHFRRYTKDKSKIILLFFCFIVSNLIGMMEPYYIGKLIDTLQQGGDNLLHNTIMVLIILGALPISAWLFHATGRIIEERNRFQVGKTFREIIFHYTVSLPLSRHNDNHTGQTIDQFNKAGDGIRNFAGNNYLYIGTAMRFISSIAMLIWIWPLGGSIICLVGCCTFFIVRRFDQIIIPLEKLKNKRYHKLSSMLFDYLSNIKTIITIRCESIVAKVLSNQNETIREPFYRHNILNETKRFIVNIILTLISSITIGFYVYNHIVAGTVILVGTVAMIYQYVQRLSGSFYNFAWLYSQLVTNKTDFQTVEHIIEAYQDTHKKEDEQALGLRNHIAIRDLHFSYSKNKEVLNTINLDIRSGQKIALVGSSGNGKSTLLGLLRGLYDANKVSVAIDGKKYDNLNPLHNISSLIPQDPEIFEHSIRYNITMGNEVDDLELQKYIDIACFEEVVKDLPHGLDSDIKEKGVNLSGGQKQRLALARGLFLGQSSDILLLDEATSSVDSLGEKHIYEALFREFNNKTIIASVHRLHMLDMFDMIYVIDKGRVVESGNLKTVLSLDGIAKHMRDNYMRNHHTK